MTETASPETAHASSAVPAPQHDLKTAPVAPNTQQSFDDAIKDSSSELSDLEPTENGFHDLDDSSLFNYDRPASDNGADDGSKEGPPSKKRRMDPSTPPPSASRANKSKLVSPPWKKAGADGPTSYTEAGRRKSGRINMVPLEHQPPSDKRMTRRAHGSQTSPPSKTRKPSATHIPSAAASSTRPSTSGLGTTPKKSDGRTAPSKTVQSTKPSAKPLSSRASTSRSTRRRSPAPAAQPTRHSSRPRRSTRASLNEEAASSIRDGRYVTSSPTRSRTRLHIKPTTLPLLHPGQVWKKPKLGPSFEEYWARARHTPIEEGGILALDEQYTDEQARQDARTIMRVEKAVEPGGVLSEERCSAFVPEPQDEPPRQWAHLDHLVRAAANFRKLMVGEQQRHRAQAKKLAEACREAWLRRQPKSAEEIEAEVRDAWLARYRVVMRSMFGTWDNVRAEVNKRRLQEWEAEEQRRVKAALNEAVNISEQKLQAQRGQFDSDDEDPDLDTATDDSDDEGSTDLDSILDGSNVNDGASDGRNSSDHDDDDMSSEEEDEVGDDSVADAADETLTQDQLRAKYANLPALPEPKDESKMNGNHDGTEASVDTGNPDDSTDESVDMDDDMGSSDESSGNESAESGDASSGDEEEDSAGLIGLLFDKSELKSLKEDKAESNGQSTTQLNGEGPHIGDHQMREDKAEDEGLNRQEVFEEDDEPDLVQMPLDDSFHDDDSVPQPNGHQTAGKAVDLASNIVEKPRTNGVSHGDEGDDHSEAAEPTTQLNGTAKHGVSQDVDMLDVPVEPGADSETVMAPSPTTIDKPSGMDIDLVPESAALKKVDLLSTTDAKPAKSDTASETPGAQDVTSRAASLGPAWAAKTEVPFLLRGTLREYQHYGLDWLAGLYSNNTNGILADEMGLGKTIQTIALLAHLASYHEVWGPHLVVVPTSVMLNWEMEFKKWCPGFKILAYYGTQEERKRKRHGWTNDDIWNVCITSYQLVLQDQQVFKRRRWHYLILDEAHNIKNFKSQRWQTLLGFNTQARLLLTGTPLQNNLTELWSLLFFLMPSENGVGGFADLQEFHDWFQKPESQILESGRETMDDEARAIIAKLHKVLRPYLLRRLKADVEKQMPAKYEHVEFCRLSKRQRELYDGFLARTDTRDTLASGNYMSIINCLMQLRKVCNHPDLFVDRPIMTSFRQQRSVPSEYDLTNQFVQRSILANDPMKSVALGVINLIPTQHEGLSNTIAERISQLSLHRALMDLRETQSARAHLARTNLDPTTAQSNLVYLESLGRWRRFEELQHCVYLNALRGQRRPIYGKRLIDFLTLGLEERPRKPRPRVPQKILQWFSEDSGFLRAVIQDRDTRAASMEMTISKFACVTPSVVTRDMSELVLGKRAVDAFTDADLKLSAPRRWAPFMDKHLHVDPWHESRMRLSIQFPDKRLLQYDCGKLQALDKLLRRLQAGGHRALIFTQMTKVLDILEQFLNIHGHKYLRLDGATKIEQRQILTDRFNADPRILCFILSTRSGGLGINLTGADTVIFYDQDWNPAMDKQCQDRCHRIGQTRDVHIYRLVSEHTIEANILRKASQKQMLDDVVIQEGGFNTEYFNRITERDVVGEDADLVKDGMDAANAAMDRLLGGVESNEKRAGKVFEQAEDKEDVDAAKAAEREIQADDADFQDKASGANSGASSTRQGTPRDDATADNGGIGPSNLGRFSESVGPDNDEEVEVSAWGERIRTIDDYMLRLMSEQLKGTPLELPKDKKKSKKKRGRDTRKR